MKIVPISTHHNFMCPNNRNELVDSQKRYKGLLKKIQLEHFDSQAGNTTKASTTKKTTLKP